MLLSDATLERNLSKKCQQIQDLLTTAAKEPLAGDVNVRNSPIRHKLYELVEARRRINNAQAAERKSLSKAIKKEAEAIRRIESKTKIGKILSDFRGLRRIAGTRRVKGRH